MRRLLCLFAAIASLLISAVARADSPFDPAHADDIARRVLLSPTDLPGDGWSVQSIAKDVNDAVGAAPDTPACARSLEPMLESAGKHPDGTIAGQSAEALSHKGSPPLPVPTVVTLEIDVHEDDRYLDDAMERSRDVLAGPDLATCLGDLFARDLSGSLKVTVRQVEPLTIVPNDGIGSAVEITMGSGVITVSVRMEFYVWLYGNVVVQASVLGSSANVTSDLVGAVVGKTQANLQREATAGGP